MAEIETGMTREEHFSEEDWVDFARQQGSMEQHARLARHLDGGCERCRPTVEFWQAVRGLAGQEASYRPPEGSSARPGRSSRFGGPKGSSGG